MTENDVKRIQDLGVETKFYQKSEMNIEPYNYEMLKMDGCCIFLSGNRCTIYEKRPLICRFYPFTMFEAHGYVFDVDRSCEGVSEGKFVDKRYLSDLIQEAKKTIREARHACSQSALTNG
ncbi:MAG: YkgJ family cysteine cluster protein [Candidatus Methylarchaceae archaeon HK02M1]|nr:YkgJ family cysteine cluster protein [Candidatus Methylarchaceae archaeon HK02M1]